MCCTAKQIWGLRLAVVLAVLAGAAACAAPANAAGMLVADGGFGGALEVKDQDIHVTINNGIAVTEVEQVFVNKEQRVVEALYTFPVPKGASVSNFSMWIGGKEMVGEVVEKHRAREIYESYKQTRRDPGLLEQVDYKRFEMRIFPIPAGGEQRVRITYYQELDFDHDQASYVYPLTTVAVAGAKEHTTGRLALSIDVKSEVPIAAMKSPSHNDQFVIVQHADPKYWQASFEVQGGDLSRDLVIDYTVERPHTGIDLVTSKASGEDGYFQLTLPAGKELETQLAGSDYVFVVDVSGSMMYDGKLALSRDAVGAFVQSLSDQDRFELIAFNIAATPLFNSASPVNEETRRKAIEFLRSQKAMGGTVLNPAIEAAYRYHASDRQLNVVVLSDGMTEQNLQRELLQLIDRRPSGVSVFCIGVGNEVNRPLLAQLAEKTGGLAAFMSTGANFERQAQAFRRKLTRPAATNVRLAIDGTHVYDVEPEVLPNLYHGQPVRLYGRYKRGGEATIQVKAEILGSPLEQSLPVTLPDSNLKNPEIERMWATHRVDRLMAQGRADGTQGQLDEVVRLCEGYSIASQYASFIVLENDAEYQRWKIKRHNATRIGRDRQAQLAVREELAQLRHDTAGQVGPQKASEATGQHKPRLEGQTAQANPYRSNREKRKSDLGLSKAIAADAPAAGPVGSEADADEATVDDAAYESLATASPSDRSDVFAADAEAAPTSRAALPAQLAAMEPREVKSAVTPVAAKPTIEGPATDADIATDTKGPAPGGSVTGGGAIDPLTALAAAALAGLGWASRRSRRRDASAEA